MYCPGNMLSNLSFPDLMRKLSAILAIFTSLILADGHFLVLQSFTWVQMSWDASQSETISVGDVFSGRVRCDRCEAIEKGRESKREAIDFLVKERILALVRIKELKITDRPWYRVAWPADACLPPSQFDGGVILPPPQV